MVRFQGLRGGHQGGHRCPHCWSMMTRIFLPHFTDHIVIFYFHVEKTAASKRQRKLFSSITNRKTQSTTKEPIEKIMGEHTIDYLLHWGEPSTSVSRPDSSEASSFSSCWSYCGENYKATNTSAPLSLLASWGFFSGSITAHLTEPRCVELLAQHEHGSNC